MTDELYLAPDVFVCTTEGHGVFLNLKRDKYSAIRLLDADAAGPAGLLKRTLAAKRHELIEGGVLTNDAVSGRPLDETPIEGFDGHILGLTDQRIFGVLGTDASGLSITVGEVCDFLSACWQASHDLKTKHISKTVAEVRQRKADALGVPLDVEKTRRLTRVFQRLRPWFPRAYLCLFDSLALLHFLARRKVYPLWIFAVNARPFNAHCWVQSQRLLLNENSEFAGEFTPIMAI